ncbi:MAG: hypothetical protein NPIRA01_21460 [Nitrospirales bacterium]|nr:MAG: hypothetical protein NPIRA01_21460 [Nitrospirales bacterium]
MTFICCEEAFGHWAYTGECMTIHLPKTTDVRNGVTTTVTQDFPKEGVCVK